jgi:hypothetical protein
VFGRKSMPDEVVRKAQRYPLLADMSAGAEVSVANTGNGCGSFSLEAVMKLA